MQRKMSRSSRKSFETVTEKGNTMNSIPNVYLSEAKMAIGALNSLFHQPSRRTMLEKVAFEHGQLDVPGFRPSEFASSMAIKFLNDKDFISKREQHWTITDEGTNYLKSPDEIELATELRDWNNTQSRKRREARKTNGKCSNKSPGQNNSQSGAFRDLASSEDLQEILESAKIVESWIRSKPNGKRREAEGVLTFKRRLYEAVKEARPVSLHPIIADTLMFVYKKVSKMSSFRQHLNSVYKDKEKYNQLLDDYVSSIGKHLNAQSNAEVEGTSTENVSLAEVAEAMEATVSEIDPVVDPSAASEECAEDSQPKRIAVEVNKNLVEGSPEQIRLLLKIDRE